MDKPQKWNGNVTTKFIHIYEKNPCLWNTRYKSYKSKEMRSISYRNILNGMGIEGMTILEVKTKIKNLRTTYSQELKKVEKARARGYTYYPSLVWYDDIDRFLKPFMLCKTDFPQVSNQDIKVENDYQSESVENQCETLTNDTDPLAEMLNQNESMVESVLEIENKPIDEYKLEAFNETNEEYETSSFQRQKRRPAKRRNTIFNSVAETSSKKVSAQDEPSVLNINLNEYVNSTVQRLQEMIQSNAHTSKLMQKEDEFDIFGRSIASQLRQLSLPTALRTQASIQSLLSEERIKDAMT